MNNIILKRKKLITKILSLFLVFSIIFSMIPNIFANSNEFEQGNDPDDRYSVYIDVISIEKIWDDKGFENKRPEEITMAIYGVDRATTDQSLWTEVDRITLDKDCSIDDYTWLYEYSQELPYYDCYYLAELNTESSNYQTEPVMFDTMFDSMPMSLRNEYDVAPAASFINEMYCSITNKYIDKSRDVQFNVKKTWVDLNNQSGKRPTSIEVEIYGVESEGVTEGGELLKTVTLTGLEAQNFNVWEKTTETFKTSYEYFYVKEKNVNNSYSVSISPIEKTNPINIIDNSTTNNSDISFFADDSNFIYLNKTWNDNNNEKGKRPESVTINAYTDNTKSEVFFKIKLSENDCEILEDPYSINFYNIDPWSIESRIDFFNEMPDLSNLYIEEICDDYVSSINIEKDNSEMTIDIANTYTETKIDYYSVTITNTIKQASKYEFEINKSWDDESNILGLRPESINIEIYGTETKNSTSGGELLATIPLNSSNASATTSNIWTKVVEVYTNYPFFYAKETVNNGETFGDYLLTLNKVTKLDNIGVENYYYINLTNKLAVTTFNIQKIWEDNNDPYNLRPESIEFIILQNGKPYKTINLTKEDAINKNTWLKENISVPTFDKNEKEYQYTIQEISNTNYTSSSFYTEKYEGAVRVYFEELELPQDMYDLFILYEQNNKFYQIEVATSGIYVGQYINGKKCIEIPVSEFYFCYGFSNNKNLMANGIIKVESIEKIPSTNKTGYYYPYFDKAFYEAMPNFEIIQDVSKVQVDINKHEDLGITNPRYGEKYWRFNGYASNMFIITNTALPPDSFKITKIWDDENNKYNTRPETLNINVYQNDNLFKTITLTKDSATSTNIWETVITAPTADINGNKYIYTIKEDLTNLNLKYYYYEGQYDSDTLTVTNKGIWIPPTESDETPKHTISINKKIINKNNILADLADFLKIKLNISNDYNFVVTLKQMNKTIIKGPTGMIEEYNGYSGNIYNGIITNNNGITFSNLNAGKYEISENAQLLFKFIDFNKISSTENISLTNENGKYYITISEFITTNQSIEIELTNKINENRFYVDFKDKKNLFKFI